MNSYLHRICGIPLPIRYHFLVGLVAFLVTACSSKTTTPSITYAILTSSSTPPIANTPNETSTITPIPTPSPTSMPLATITPRAINTFTPIHTPSQTPNLEATADVNALLATVQPRLYASYPSPNGKWLAEVIRYDCIDFTFQDFASIIAYEQLKIIRLSDRTEKVVDDQLQYCDGIGKYGLGGLYWSTNNRYFYYTGSREGNPETCGEYWVDSIYRVDVVAQKVYYIGGGHLSPDKTKLAFWQDKEIVIWDINDDEIGRVQALIPDAIPGDISWSPDSQSIAYLQTTNVCAPDYGSTYIIRFDLPSLSQRLLFEQVSPGFGRLSWDTANKITLKDGRLNSWTYNLASKELNANP